MNENRQLKNRTHVTLVMDRKREKTQGFGMPGEERTQGERERERERERNDLQWEEMGKRQEEIVKRTRRLSNSLFHLFLPPTRLCSTVSLPLSNPQQGISHFFNH